MGSDVKVRDEDVRSLVYTQVWQQRRQFANLLPADVDADAFAGLAAAAIWRDPKLALAALNSPDSLLIALREAARLGHEPGTEAYYLTVRSNGVFGIEGYQGVIDRMYRSGGVIAVHADVITKEEDSAGAFVRHDPAPPTHQRQLSRDTSVDNLAGVYAYAILTGGVCSRVVVMGRSEVMRHREAAMTKNVWDGPFGISMWLKTPVDEVRKWVPTSAAYRKERARADVEMARLLGQAPQGAAGASETPDPHSPMGGQLIEPTDALNGPTPEGA
jgi:recombination protein RecT